jgi:CheY-like chemotaxis protein
VTQGHSILIVEDDPEIRETLKEIIELEGYSALTASDGQKALDLLRGMATRPCLVLLDLMMPVMNGWELLEHRERDLSLASIPVVVISAAGDRAQKASATAHIKKPVDIDVLLKTVHQFCGEAFVDQQKAS